MGVYWIHPDQKYWQVAGSRDYGNETSDSTKYGKLFTSWGTVSFSRNSLLHAPSAAGRRRDVSRLHEWELKIRNALTVTSAHYSTTLRECNAVLFFWERSRNWEQRPLASSRFNEIWHPKIFRKKKKSRKFRFHQNRTRIVGTLHFARRPIQTFLIISRSILLRMRNVSDKSCRENQNTHFVFSNFSFFFRKLCRLCDNVEK